MEAPGPCALHESAILIGTDRSETLLRLAQSPMGDECQKCHVCRSARTYVQRRLEEAAGVVLPRGENAEAAWRVLQRAVEEARAAMHGSG